MSKMKVKTSTGIAGLYRFTILDAKTRKVKYETPVFSNLITDLCLERIGNETSWSSAWDYCSVGTGTTSPANSDTQLESRVATTGGLASQSQTRGNNPPEYYAEWVLVFEFPEGAAAGNLSEVGVGFQSDGTDLQSRALIVDGNGDPTTITVLSDEILQVSFIRRLYPNTTDVTGTITLDGNTYDYTLRPYNLNSSLFWNATLARSALANGTSAGRNEAWESDMVDMVTVLSGSSDDRSSYTIASYVSSSHERKGTLIYDLAVGNFATGIGTITWTTDLASGWQIGFNPKIPKDNTQKLEIEVVHSWGRYTP